MLNTNGETARETFKTIAAECGGGVWDLYEVMGGLGSSEEWRKTGLMQRDRVHFTRLGYKIVGEMLYDAFVKFYADDCE